MQKEIVPCPFCKTDSAHFQRVRKSDDIVQCNQCLIVFLRTRPNLESLQEHYQTYADEQSHMRIPKTVAEINNPSLRRQYMMTRILRYAAKGPLLDIGCGWGPFLLNARDNGFTPFGVEITRKAVEFARSPLCLPVAEDLQTMHGMAFHPFNAVVMNHTLEHMPEPRAVMEWIYTHLRPKGVFAGIVPNYASIPSVVLGEDWEWLDPTMHYVHFTPDTLAHWLYNTGFTVREIHTWHGDASPAQLAASLERIAQGVEFPKKQIGPEMVFVAQKEC